MCCFLTVLILFGPRVATVIWWIFNPVYYQLVFGNILLPIMGIIIIPWTTLMYLIVYPGGISGFDYFWLALAVIVDIATYTSTAYTNRKRIPGFKDF